MCRKKFYIIMMVISFMVLVLVGIGCPEKPGGGGIEFPGNDQLDSSDPSVDSVGGVSILPISNNSGELVINNAVVGNQYVIVVGALPNDASNPNNVTGSFIITASNPTAAISPALNIKTKDSKTKSLSKEELDRLAFDYNLRVRGRYLALNGFKPASANTSNIKYKIFASGVPSVGFFGNQTGPNIKLTANNEVTSEYIYVTSRVIALYDTTSGSANTTIKNNIKNVVDAFENYIYGRNTKLYGNPSDVDSNGKIGIVFSSNLTGGAYGYFDASDLFKYDGTNNPSSDEADLLYINVSKTVAEMKSTLAHEFQHLINYNNKTFTRISSKDSGLGTGSTTPAGIPVSALYEEEGLSHLAEDINGYGDETNGPAQIVYNYIYDSNYNGVSMFDVSNYCPINTRANNYLFLRYLLERSGSLVATAGSFNDGNGVNFIKNLVSSDKSGPQNIVDTYNSVNGTAKTYTSLYMDWLCAMFNDEKEQLSIDRFKYLPLGTDPVTSQYSGVSLVGTRASKTFTGVQYSTFSSTTLNGSVATGGAFFAAYQTSTNGTFKFTFSSSASTLKFVARVLRVK